MNGKYLVPWAREGRPLPGTRDVVLGEKLWRWLEDQVKGIDEAELGYLTVLILLNVLYHSYAKLTSKMMP